MARGPSNSPNRTSSRKKKPATTKVRGGTAKAKKTAKRSTPRKQATAKATRKARSTGRKATRVKGKPKTASTRSHGGASKAPAKRAKVSRKRVAQAQSKGDQAQAQGGGEGGGDAPGAIGARREVRDPNVPGYRNTVDATKYDAMRDVLMDVLPTRAPGVTQNEMLELVLPKLPQAHFPRGDKAMWWLKTVQLDQEARGAIRREATKPSRWWRAASS